MAEYSFNHHDEALLGPPSQHKSATTSANGKQICMRLLPWVMHGTFLCLWATLIGHSLYSVDTYRREPSAFSPALEVVEYETVFFNGSLALQSEYRGPPGPYIDAAWERLIGGVLPMRIADDTLTRIGMAHRPSIVGYREEDGGGYMATIEVSHQMHCLNMLRRHTYFDYYEPIKHSNPPGDAEFYRIHLGALHRHAFTAPFFEMLSPLRLGEGPQETVPQFQHDARVQEVGQHPGLERTACC